MAKNKIYYTVKKLLSILELESGDTYDNNDPENDDQWWDYMNFVDDDNL